MTKCVFRVTQCSTAESSVCGVCLVARNNRGQRAKKLRVLRAVWRLGINHRRPIHARHRKSPGPVPTNSHPNSLNGRRLLGGSGASGRQRLLSFACVRLAFVLCSCCVFVCFRLVFYNNSHRLFLLHHSVLDWRDLFCECRVSLCNKHPILLPCARGTWPGAAHARRPVRGVT